MTDVKDSKAAESKTKDGGARDAELKKAVEKDPCNVAEFNKKAAAVCYEHQQFRDKIMRRPHLAPFTILMPRNPVGELGRPTAVAERTFSRKNTDAQTAVSAPSFGVRNTDEKDAFNLRVAKRFAVGASHSAKITETTPGGEAIVELNNEVKSSIGGNAAVERNVVNERDTLPRQPKNMRISSTYWEIIARTHQGSISRTQQYKFNTYAEAEKFLTSFSSKQSLLVKYSPVEGMQARFDEEYRAYTRAQGQEKGAYGREYGIGYSPLAGKAYFSTTFLGLRDAARRPAPGGGAHLSEKMLQAATRALPQKVGDVVKYGGTAYAEVGGEVKGAAKCTATTQAEHIFTEDLNPSAPYSCFVQMGYEFRAFGAVSVGSWTPVAGLKERSDTRGTGFVLDSKGDWVQSFAAAEIQKGHLSDSWRQQFLDLRLNFHAANAESRGRLQALYSNLDIDRMMVKVEVRQDSENTPVETLMRVRKNQLDDAGPHERIKAISERGASSPFSEQDWRDWEKNARGYYEARVNKAPLSDDEWKGVLHSNLTGGFLKNVEYGYDLVADRSKARWADRFITPERMNAYESWSNITSERLAQYEAQLKKMQPQEIYNEYAAKGLRYPGVHISYLVGEKNEVMEGGGFSIPKSLSDKMNGLYQVRYTHQTGNYTQVGNYGIAEDAWPKAEAILKDPVAGPAFLAVMNQNGYPRFDKSGNPLAVSPLAAFMYHGTTPTRLIADLEKDTGYTKDYSKIRGVYKVRTDDGTDFDTIGRHALERFYAGPVSPAEARAYGEKIRQLNFDEKDRPEQELFNGAILILPSPPQGTDFRTAGGGASQR